MKLSSALCVIVIVAGACRVTKAEIDEESSASSITLLVKLYRTVGSRTTVQLFNITLSGFSSILRKLTTTLEDQPSSDLNNRIASLASNLQQLITRITQDTQDGAAIKSLSNNLLRLINLLSASNDPKLTDILGLLESSFTSDPSPVDASYLDDENEAMTPVKSRGSRNRKRPVAGRRTYQRSLAKAQSPDVVVVNMNLTNNNQIENVINTLTTLLDSTSDPDITDTLNQLINQLRSFSENKDSATLIDILRTSLPLFNRNDGNLNLSGTAYSIVSALMASLDPSEGMSQLLAFLMGLVGTGQLTTAQTDETLGLLRTEGTENLLAALQTVLQTLSSRIPSQVSPSFNALQEQLNSLASDQDSAAITNTLSALRNLVKSVMSYGGPDRFSLVGIARMITSVLMSALRDNPSAVATLRSLWARLNVPAMNVSPAVRAPIRSSEPIRNRQLQPRCGAGLLTHLVCFAGDVLVGPGGDTGLVGSMTGLLGGVFGGSTMPRSSLRSDSAPLSAWSSDSASAGTRGSDRGWGLMGMFRGVVDSIFGE